MAGTYVRRRDGRESRASCRSSDDRSTWLLRTRPLSENERRKLDRRCLDVLLSAPGLALARGAAVSRDGEGEKSCALGCRKYVFGNRARRAWPVRVCSSLRATSGSNGNLQPDTGSSFHCYSLYNIGLRSRGGMR